MKTAIVTDSTSYLSAEHRKEKNIQMIPLQVTFGGHQSFKEEMELTMDEFYKKAKTELPKTSQPSLGEFKELYSQLAEEVDDIISIHLSSGISGTYAGAIQAGEMIENANVHVFDTEVSCAIQGFFVTKAADMANAGESAAVILEELERMKKTMRAYFMVEDLKHLQRGGRLSGAQALVGGLLQIKPILHFEEKVIVPFEKIRTRKKAMARIAGLLKEDADKGLPLRATIIHANQREEAEAWLAELEQSCPNVEFDISYFGPVIGTHLGEGSMGLGWVVK